MKVITKAEYDAIHRDYKGVWTTERWDIPDWEHKREKYMGKRTILSNENGATVLLIEGMSLTITE